MGTLARSDVGSLSLRERLQMRHNASALILDISGSMNSDCEPGKYKIQALNEIVASLKGDATIVIFSTDAKIVSKQDIPTHGYGSTNMARAINLLKSQGTTSAVMITDGDSTDRSETLQAVENFTLQILYVGPGDKPAFLDELAKKAGGFCTKDDIKETKQVTEKVQLLLGPGSSQNQRRDIQL